MAKQKKTLSEDTRSGRFVIGRGRFTRISAVEGIQLTKAMAERAVDADEKGLTAEEYRRAIVRSYRKG
jgi:hypothetical protein